VSAFRILRKYLLAEAANEILHFGLVRAVGAKVPIDLLSTGVTVVLIVLAARASAKMGKGVIGSASLASLLWLWSMVCGALLNGLMPDVSVSAAGSASPWLTGMAVAALLFWPLAFGIGALGAWSWRRFGKLKQS
jgi:hypothetical protein